MKGNSYVPFMLRRGDGSTLSLDFTAMGDTLDSRFTFTRSSTATFINSSGYVQYANHNLVRNSTFSSLTGWAPNGTGTTTNAGGVLTLSTSAAQTQLYYSQTNANGFQDNAPVSGRVYSASINITAVSGGITYQELITIGGTISSVTRYNNGVLVSDSATASTGLITIVWTSGGANALRIGIGASGSASYPSASVSMTLPRCVIGSQTQPTYIESPVASTYHAPRFDYDPNTLTARGLLIEGSATNLSRYSETLETTGGFWGYNAATRTVESSDVNPTGGTGSISFVPSSNGGSRYAGIFLTGQTTASIYTYSIWLKGKGTTACVISIQSSAGAQNATMTILSQPAGANASITGNGTGFPRISNLSTTGWTKVQVVLSANLGGTGTLNVFMYPNDTSSQTTADSLYAWGAQLEAGSGASSYIPTGSSQVARAADTCIAASTGFSSWFTGGTTGTFYADWFGGVRGITSTVRTVLSTSDVTGRHLHLQQTAAAGNLKVADFGAANSVTTSNSITSGARTKGAFSFSGSTVNLTLNGGTVASGTLAFSSAPTWLSIGAPSTNGTSITGTTVVLNNSIQSIKYWPSVLPNTTLQDLTT